eukprot:gene9562-biopygen16734
MPAPRPRHCPVTPGEHWSGGTQGCEKSFSWRPEKNAFRKVPAPELMEKSLFSFRETWAGPSPAGPLILVLYPSPGPDPLVLYPSPGTCSLGTGPAGPAQGWGTGPADPAQGWGTGPAGSAQCWGTGPAGPAQGHVPFSWIFLPTPRTPGPGAGPAERASRIVKSSTLQFGVKRYSLRERSAGLAPQRALQSVL